MPKICDWFKELSCKKNNASLEIERPVYPEVHLRPPPVNAAPPELEQDRPPSNGSQLELPNNPDRSGYISGTLVSYCKQLGLFVVRLFPGYIEPAPDVIERLLRHGLSDVTDQLNTVECGRKPVAGGGLGDVYKGALRDGQIVAIKCVRSYITTQDPNHLKFTAHEIYAWSKCDHENVLKLLGLAQYADRVAMVSPWMDGGTLPNYLTQHPDTDRCKLSNQITMGLAHLHQRGIIHGDIKGANILMTKDGVAKISDFGNAVLPEYSLGFSKMENFTHSTRWTAPEIFDGSSTYSMKADVYALGMTILEVFTGKIPFWEKSIDRAVAFSIGVQKEYPLRPNDVIPQQSKQGDLLWELLLSCWSPIPSERPTCLEVKKKLEWLDPSGLVSTYADESTGGMPAAEIINRLVTHGTLDLTAYVNLPRCSDHPINGGGFSDIYSGELLDGSKVSLKCLRIHGSLSDQKNKFLKRAAREAYTWSKLQHENVHGLLGLAQFRGQVAMVSPWMRNGFLPHYIQDHPTADRYLLSTQVSLGLEYLHSCGITHGNVRGRSVLISEDGVAKLSEFDFSLMEEYTSEYSHTPEKLQGSTRWTAPELLLGTISSYGVESDVYALGMTILETITGQIPYSNIKAETTVMFNVVQKRTPERPFGSIPENDCGNALWNLLLNCWNQDFVARPTAAEVASVLKTITQYKAPDR